MIKILSNGNAISKNYRDVAIGDTFIDENNNIYMKVSKVTDRKPVYDGKHYSTLDLVYDCVSLKDGTFTTFVDSKQVFLIDCEMKWKYKGLD